MSALGGDSWAREAQNRKRRVDDLILSSSSSFKMLSNGKYACLVCPNNPILDSPLMLSMHKKRSRHIAAESRLREKELVTQSELNKRIALSSDSNVLATIGSSTTHVKCNDNQNKPLIEQTRWAILEAQSSKFSDVNARNDRSNARTRRYIYTNDLKLHNSCNSVEEQSVRTGLDESNSTGRERFAGTEARSKMLVDWNAQLQKRQEKELKLTAAGWKRDCHGKWYRDENAEFDSDEEDPNVYLS